MTKDGINSQTLWGLVVLLIGPAAARYGVDNDMLQSIGTALFTLVGIGQVWYGRQRAGNQITSIAGVPVPDILIVRQEHPKP